MHTAKHCLHGCGERNGIKRNKGEQQYRGNILYEYMYFSHLWYTSVLIAALHICSNKL